jgi:hypothetical protein
VAAIAATGGLPRESYLIVIPTFVFALHLFMKANFYDEVHEMINAEGRDD